MEGTPGPAYDIDDSGSVYHGGESSNAANGDGSGQHSQGQLTAAQKANNATHIRSRITVVCAECKRLKLKCDRRTPCGSCIKRDTTPRCTYSQAAAEKIDVQSLHNRLLVVEGQVATLTAASAASNPSIPPFRSSYPSSSSQLNFPQQSSASSSSNRSANGAALGYLPCNDHFLLVSGQSGSSLVVNLQDTAGIWLTELESQLGGIEDSSPSRTPSVSPYSVARPPVTTGGPPRVKLEPTPVALSSLSTSSSPTDPDTPTTANPANISGFVPPLPYDLFLPASATNAGVGTSTSSTPQYPQVTPALLKHFPSSVVRARYLEALSEAMKVHPSFNVRHFQQRVEAMAAWGEANGDPRAKSELARELFTAGPKAASSSKERSSPPPSPKPTLSFFSAAACALALGSLMTRDNGEPSGADAATRQRNSPAALFALSKQALGLFEETQSYDIDSVIAMLLQVLYMLHDGQMRIAHPVFPLVGKMINVARMMGMAIDPDEFPGTYSLFEAETRRRVWWDIYYYDMVISECMGHHSLITESSFSTRVPADVDEEKFSPSSTTIPSAEEGSPNSTMYFILRCRLAQLVKSIRRQITRDIVLEESSEASIEQAAIYENQVTTFINELPPVYRLNMDLDASQPLEDDSVLLAQRSALVIIANRVVIKLYLRFMNDMSDSSPAKTSHQAVLGTINAAHQIIYASGILYAVWHDKRPGIFEYYDYSRSLFDAAVICAQAVIQQPSSILASEGIKGIKRAVEIMRMMNIAMPHVDPNGVASEAIRMVEMMQEKAERARTLSGSPDAGALAGTKRKRTDGELTRITTLTTGFVLPFVGPSVSSVQPRAPRAPLMMSKLAKADAPPRDGAKARPRDRDGRHHREKDKGAKPAWSVRVRTAAGPPPAVRQRTSSGSGASLVSPTPGVGPPAHSSTARTPRSAAQTPVSDGGAFPYPPLPSHAPAPPPQHQQQQQQQQQPHPMEAMQHDFQMDFGGHTPGAEGALDGGGRYAHSYASSPQTSSSLYEHGHTPRHSPYAATGPSPPGEAFRGAGPPPQHHQQHQHGHGQSQQHQQHGQHGHSQHQHQHQQHQHQQEYYALPYPPSGAPSYAPSPVEHASFPVTAALGAPLPPSLSSSVPGTPREPPRFLGDKPGAPPPHAPSLPPPSSLPPSSLPPSSSLPPPPPGYEEKPLGHEYARALPMTATALSAPYVQGWQPPEMGRENGMAWDYKFYSHAGGS